MEHTPGEWHVSKQGQAVCAESDDVLRPDARIIANIMDPDDHQHQTPVSLSNAAYIVKAANAFPTMLEALEEASERLHHVANGAGPVKKLTAGQLKTECREIRDIARAAIEAARS